MALVFGRVPHPPFVDRLIPSSQTSAWNDLGPRVPFGTCQHSMVGYLWSTDKWFRDDPSTGRVATGLTDYGVGGSKDGPEWDGVILRWNDPRGRRAGWANGGSDGLEGDGLPFVRTLGINAINRNLVSIERSDGGDINTPLSPKQFESLCQLHAYWFDQIKVPYTDFPHNVHIAGNIITYLEHWEFATKACPFPPVRTKVTAMQTRIREIMKQYQGEAAPVPTPEPKPEPTPEPTPTPPVEDQWPNGWTTEELDKHFGELIRIDMRKGFDQMITRETGFNAKGVISNAWVQRCVEDGITKISRMPVPSHQTITQSKDGVVSQLVSFPRSGYDDWIAFKGDGNAGWRWLQ